MGRIAATFIRHLKPAFILLLLGSGAAGVYLLNNGILIDYNVESFLPEDHPVIQQYRSFSEQFPRDDAFVIVAFASDSLFSGGVLTDIRNLTRAFEEIPTVDKVSSITNHERLTALNDEIRLERTISHFGTDQDILQTQKTRILGDTTAVGYLASRAGDVAAFYIHMAIEGAGYDEREVVISGAKEVTDAFSDRYDFKYSGIPYIRNVYVDSIGAEARRYVWLSTLVILIALLWLFRNVRGVVLPVLIVYLGMLWTISIMMVAGAAIDVLSSTIAAIILVVGVADSVHLLSRFNDGIAHGLSRREAARDMIVSLGSATFLTSITTAVGFATLGTSPIVPMRQFGLFTAVGVVATFFVSIIVLSAALTWLPAPKTAGKWVSNWFHGFLTWIDRFCARYWRSILWSGLLISVLALAAASRLRVNSYVNDDLGPRTQIYQDMEFIQDRLVSPFPMEILIEGDGKDALHDPEVLRQVRELQEYLDSEPTVGRTISIVDLLDEMNRTLNPEHAADGLHPDLVAQYLFLLEMIGPDETMRLISQDHSKLRVAMLVDDAGSATLKPMLGRVDSVMNIVLRDDLKSTWTGTVVLISTVSDLITDSLLISIGLAFVFISLIMALLFRSAALLIISLLPNVFPLIVTAGFMGLAGIDIKPATAVIFSISFGIAVDDTIHLLARLRQELRLGRPMRDAIRLSLLGTGKAIILTSIILAGGFAVLTTSQFQSSNYMGGLISLTLVAALAADLLLLPALLHAWTKFSTPSTRED